MQAINISDKHQCIFIHIPKVAGTSVKEVLELPGQGHPPWFYFAEQYPEKWRSYLKFTIVRNPWDRIISSYSYARMETSYWHNSKTVKHPDYDLLKNKSFDDFCEVLYSKRDLLKHESWRPQCDWLVGMHQGRKVLTVELVLKFENLTDDFSDLCKRLGIANTALPFINPSPHKNYREYYDKRTIWIIEQVFAQDIAAFGYTF